ncbi:PTS sugar transporter subunit IIA [Desulfovibrio sp. OttesenSCG-928-G15]|nr:PTS sugar transporter subunit IIA [Desulfovibrio sp. OttesenSCG-928-G15]
MNIADILPVDAIVPDMKALSQTGVFEELIAPLVALHPDLQDQALVKALCEREMLGSTAIGEGVAIPHGKVAGLENVLLAVGRSITGVDFDAPDSKPCQIFFLILAPEHGAGMHLKLLAQIARRAKDPVFRSEIMLASGADQIRHAFTAP